MSVYFIHCPVADAVKIGHAGDVFARFSQIQTAASAELKLLAFEDGSVEREAELHSRFSDLRIRGEWFAFAPELQSYIGALPPIERGRRRKPLQGKLGQWLIGNGLTLTEFAKKIGATKGSVSWFCNGRTIPRPDLMVRIYVATQGAVQPNDFYDLPELSA